MDEPNGRDDFAADLATLIHYWQSRGTTDDQVRVALQEAIDHVLPVR